MKGKQEMLCVRVDYVRCERGRADELSDIVSSFSQVADHSKACQLQRLQVESATIYTSH